jgi:6-phosphogluconolactonase
MSASPLTRRRRLTGAAAVATSIAGGRNTMAENKPETIAYVSNAGDPSISLLAIDRATGALELIETVTIPDVKASPTSMPLALSADRRFLHAALRSEPFTVASFAIDSANGALRHLGNAPLDASMAYTTVDHTGRWLLCASYPAGKITVNPIGPDGHVTAPPKQIITDRPKAHCIVVDAANKHAYCSVLAQDLILQFNFDAATGALTPNSPAEIKTKAGAGPRHMALHPNGRLLFLITETTATIGSYAIDPANGTLKELHFVDMLAPDYKGEIAAADLHVTPDGRLLYGSERRTSSLVGFRIDAQSGTLTLIGRWPTETTPRGFAIEPRGHFLLAVGLDSNHLTAYAIGADGVLAPAKQLAVGKMPNWIEFVDLH